VYLEHLGEETIDPVQAPVEGLSFRMKLKLKRCGFSIINSNAREIAYVFLRNISLSYGRIAKNHRASLKMGDLQIDN